MKNRTARRIGALLMVFVMLFTLLPASALVGDGDSTTAAVTPLFITDLSTTAVNYTVGDTAAALNVAASVTDGGTTSYQWYSNSLNSTTSGTAIAIGDSYTPSTSIVGTSYYYVIVTNTLDSTTASATSSIATVTISLSQSVSADTSWYAADSTTYTLTNEAQLRGLATLVNDSGISFEGKTINLGNDIAIVGGDWPMIGNNTNKFIGTFDGKNHTVSGFYIKITSTDENIYKYQGFFGYLGSMSTIQNLKLDGTVADGKRFCAILAGYADTYCTINNCVTNGTVLFTDNKQNTIYTAGMVGNLDQYGIMTDCINNANVIVNMDTLTVSSTNFAAAGLIGYLDPHGEVKSCVNNGTVSCTVGSCGSKKVSPIMGGIVGITGTEITLTDCTNNGAITCNGIISSTQTSIGGIVGSSYTAVISGCQNNAKISCMLADSTGASRAFAGGITGGSNSSLSSIKSTKYNLTVDNCINNGEVDIICQTASNIAFAGGIVGGSGIMLTAITSCENTGSVNVTCTSGTTVTGTNTGVGGIIGNAFNLNTDAEISNCVNSGTVFASANYVGGVTGKAATGLLITDCYDTASVTGADYVGGIVGNLECSLQSVFNYGGSVTASSGSNMGMIVGSGATETNTSNAYYLETSSLTGAETATDTAYTIAKSAEGFTSYDLVYALNSIGSTVEDRCVWKQGKSYPQFVSGGETSVYEVKTVSGENGTVSCSKQYLSKGESYAITFTPAEGYILKNFTVFDINGNSYKIYLNNVENSTYSVTLADADSNTYAASFSQNVLTCTMDTHSMFFVGEFTTKVTGAATVILNGNGGWWNNNKDKITDTLSVDAGALLTLADLTQPQEYRNFAGWYTDVAGTTPFNFSTVITKDTTLYAKWDENSCVVSYQLNGGSWSANSYTTVIRDTCLTELTEKPVKKGYTFTGWYSDVACLNPFEFESTKINGGIYLYAGWITEGTYQVIFDANGGTFTDFATRIQLTFEIGTSIGSALEAYTISNGDTKLRGWYSAANGGSMWTLSDTLTGDLVLYAHWDTADGTPTIYSGTEKEPMELEDLQQLLALRDTVNTGSSFEGSYFKMVSDLILPSDWVPIGALKAGVENTSNGKNIYPFSGTFDGNNNTITVPEGGLSLFGYVREATIQNLNIYGTKIIGYGLINNYVVDYGSDGSYNSGTGGSYAIGCPDTVVIDNVILKSGSSTLYSGFIGGYASGGNIVTICNSTIESGVVIGYDKSLSNIGSFSGQFNGTVENCVSHATVYGVQYVGGIIGSKGQSMGICKAINCIFTGTIVSTGDYVGGIIGGGYYSSSAPNSPCVSAQNCYVTGSITGSNYVGGILGAEPCVNQCWANGIGYIQNNYFSGTINATADSATIGNIIGYMKSLDRYNIIENNYYLSTSAQTGIGAINTIDYETTSYSRSETFIAGDVCIAATSDDFASGKVAAQLNSGNNSNGIWTQSGNYPVYGTAATAIHTVTLSTVGSGTAALIGLKTDNSTVYQNAGSAVTVSETAADGNNLVRIKVVNADGATTDITDSKEFTMPQQNVAVYVVFAADEENYVDSIAVASMPIKTSYSIGDSFDVTGLTFTVTYSDGSTETFSATADMVSGFSSGSADMKTLTLTYQGSVTTFNVKVVSNEKNYITVTFSLLGDTDHGEGGTVHTLAAGNLKTWISATTVQVESSSTVGDVFAKVLDEKGYRYVGLNSNYISSITNPSGVTLAEFTNGPLSGWMYTLNSKHPIYGINEQKVADGDVIVWHYTDDYTVEEGSDKWNSGTNSSGKSNSSAKSTTITPEVTAKNGIAEIELSSSVMNDAIVSAKENSSSAIVIAPQITGDTDKVSIKIPKSSVSFVASQRNVALVVNTPVGSLSIPNDVLVSIANQTSGSTVTISFEAMDTSSLTMEQQAAVGDNTVYDISILSGDSHISGFDGSVTVSLPYTLKEGESADSITVWYLDDSGKLKQMTCTYDKKAGIASFITTHMSYYLVSYDKSTVWTNPFKDVAKSEWFYDAVKYVFRNGLMSGTSDNAFEPNADMTRAMLVTVLYRLNGKPTVSGTNSFTDVRDGQWYSDSVKWASSNGIASGYGRGIFGTNNSITREQLMTILYNYAKYKGYDVTAATELTAYSDNADISGWAQTAIKWAVSEKLISGMTGTTLVPNCYATRAQVATVLMKFVENYVE